MSKIVVEKMVMKQFNVEEAWEKHVAGATLRELGEIYGLSPSGMMQRFHAKGLKKSRGKSLDGKTFGRLTVLERDGFFHNGDSTLVAWKCQCECGNVVRVRGSSLTNGDCSSCGCLRKEILGNANKKINITKEELIRLYHEEGKTTAEIGYMFGVTLSGICQVMKKYGIKTRGVGRRAVIEIGQRFGRRVVIAREKPYWKTRCDCGTEQLLCTGTLLHPNATSCGCFRKEKRKNDRLAGHEEISYCYWSRLQRSAAERDIVFDITPEYIWSLYIQQERQCALSGRDIAFAENPNTNPELQTASLDRISSDVGYVPGNVQWVHKIVNTMKSNLIQEEFVALCSDIVRHSATNN